jgi:hypothetical protein
VYHMSCKDREQLRRWLVSKASLTEVESVESIGIVGNIRFTDQALRAYKLLWTWSAPRFTGSAGFRQERFYRKRGAAALNRRFERCKALIAKLS